MSAYKANENHQLGRRELWRDGPSELGPGCLLTAWHAGVHVHGCSSDIAQTALCCQEAWVKTVGREEIL